MKQKIKIMIFFNETNALTFLFRSKITNFIKASQKKFSKIVRWLHLFNLKWLINELTLNSLKGLN